MPQTSNPPFDMIIVDEAQDLSPCQFDMLAPGVLHDSPHPEADGHPLNPTIYFIGDSCQQIYGWRGATGDAFLPPFQPKTAASFTLTEAFRFGPEVAAVASSLLRFKGVDGAVLKGKGPSARVFRTARAPQNSPIVRLLEGGGSQATEMDLRQLVNRFRGHGALTVLCRTNKGMSGMLLSSALRLGADMPSWFIKGGGGAAKSLSPKSVLPYVRLYYGEGSLRLPGAMEAFTNWEDLRLWAEAGETNSVLLMMELVEEWERIGKGKLLAGLEAAACRRAEAEGGAEVVFVSAHGAKGLEFPVVLLADDFRCPYCRSEEGKWELLTPELLQTPYYREESNLLYVAVTRAQKVPIATVQRPSAAVDAPPSYPPLSLPSRWPSEIRLLGFLRIAVPPCCADPSRC